MTILPELGPSKTNTQASEHPLRLLIKLERSGVEYVCPATNGGTTHSTTVSFVKVLVAFRPHSWTSPSFSTLMLIVEFVVPFAAAVNWMTVFEKIVFAAKVTGKLKVAVAAKSMVKLVQSSVPLISLVPLGRKTGLSVMTEQDEGQAARAPAAKSKSKIFIFKKGGFIN